MQSLLTVAPTRPSTRTGRPADPRPVGRRIATVVVLVAAILGLPVMTPTATTVLAVAHAACPPDCGGGSNESNSGPPGGGTEFMPPQMPQPPNINGGYNYPAPDQANGISIYNQQPAAQGPAAPNGPNPQAGQSWQTAANGERQPVEYQSAPRTEQVSKEFSNLQNQFSQRTPAPNSIVWCRDAAGGAFMCRELLKDGTIAIYSSAVDVSGGWPDK